jgi:hypothetical protein
MPIQVVRRRSKPRSGKRGPTEIFQEMPEPAVLDAGVEKFREYAGRHWPRAMKDGSFKLESFDTRDNEHLRITIAVVYLAMKEADQA